MATTALPDVDERPVPATGDLMGETRSLARPVFAGPAPARPRPGRPATQSLGLRAVLIVLFGSLLTAAVVSWSFRHGRLILPPVYDDVSYMEDAARRLRILHDHGVPAVLADYAHKPPHSPYTAVMGMAAFTVFGIHDWAPYVASVVLVCGYFAMTDRLLRGLHLWQKVVAFVLIMSVPLVVRSADEFRPDHASALLLCGGLILLLERPFLSSSRRHKLWAGALIGLAVLAKPPMFIAAGLLTGWALLLATACDLDAILHLRRETDALDETPHPPAYLRAFILAARERLARWRGASITRSWTTVLLPAVLIPLPDFLVNARGIVKYIYDNMVGKYHTVWQTKGSLAFHLNYYLFGEGGQTMFGGRVTPGQEVVPYHLILLGLILIAGVTLVLARRRRAEMLRAGALAAVLLATYAIPALTKTKSIFFGLNFHTFLLLLAVLALGYLARAERLRRGRAARELRSSPAPVRRHLALVWWLRSPVGPAGAFLIAMTCGGLLAWSWPTRVGDVNADWIRNRRQIMEGVYNAVLEDPNYHDPQVFVACVGDVNAQVLNYMRYRDVAPVTFYDVPYDDVMKPALDQFDQADMVVAAETGSGLIADYLPIYRVQDRLLAELRKRQDYREIGRFIYQRTQKGFYLFEHLRSFGGWTRVEGLGPVEGPSPMTNNREVRWGWGPATTMKIVTLDEGDYVLNFVGRGWGGQEMAVRLDGKEIAHFSVPNAEWGHFTKGSVPLHLTADAHELKLEYRIWDLTTPRPMGVLFEQLLIKKAK